MAKVRWANILVGEIQNGRESGENWKAPVRVTETCHPNWVIHRTIVKARPRIQFAKGLWTVSETVTGRAVFTRVRSQRIARLLASVIGALPLRCDSLESARNSYSALPDEIRDWIGSVV